MGNELQQFRALTIHKLKEPVGFREPYYKDPPVVYPEAHALEVMTDLNFVPAATVMVGSTLQHAHQMMIDRGVRMVLVLDGDKSIQGLLTATDILGQRTVRVAKEKGLTEGYLLVDHVMTLVSDIEVLSLVDVVHARVGDVVATLRNSGRQHALVVDRETQEDDLVVRGIFSASQVARQLGIPVHVQGSENAFGDLEGTFAQIDEVIRREQQNKAAAPRL